jgi:hypothetical protein
LIESGDFDPKEDIILMPFNKACGTIELNKAIANYLAKMRGAKVWQIVAGFTKVHLSIGDRVLYDKEDAEIVDIYPNPAYAGVMPMPESVTMDYDGYDPEYHKREGEDTDIDFILAQTAAKDDKEDRVNKASHIVIVRLYGKEDTIKLESAGDVNNLLMGYALTVHKSQGSEWRRVYLCIHQSHATMIQRELLYTAVTRAREELVIICEPETFVKGITSQRVKGNTLAEKAEYFKGKLDKQAELLE